MAESWCEHFDGIANAAPQTAGCEGCTALGERDWIALRVCLSCGHVGCCEDSRHAHALAHFQATGHPLIRPLNVRDRWTWCYPHNRYFEPVAVTPAPVARPSARIAAWMRAHLGRWRMRRRRGQ